MCYILYYIQWSNSTIWIEISEEVLRDFYTISEAIDAHLSYLPKTHMDIRNSVMDGKRGLIGKSSPMKVPLVKDLNEL